MKISFKTCLVLLIPFVVFFLFENIQRLIVANHSLLYGKNLLSPIIFFVVLVYFDTELNFFIEYHINPFKKRIHQLGLLVSISIVLFAPTLYYFGNDKGFTYHEFFKNNFFPWNQIKEVKLDMDYSKSGDGILEYYLVIDKQHEINILEEIPFIYSNSEEAITKVDQILHQNKVPFKIPNYVLKNLNDFNSWDQAIIKKGIQGSK